MATILQEEAYKKPKNRSQLKGHILLDNYSDDEHVVYRDKKNKIIQMGIRGSVTDNNFKDFIVDLELAVKKVFPSLNTPLADARIKRGNDIYKRLRRNYPNHKISISGHSLGSGITETILYKNRKDKNLRGYGFNGWFGEIPSGTKPDSRFKEYSSFDPITSIRRGFGELKENIKKGLSDSKNQKILAGGAAIGYTGKRIIDKVYADKAAGLTEQIEASNNILTPLVEIYGKFKRASKRLNRARNRGRMGAMADVESTAELEANVNRLREELLEAGSIYAGGDISINDIRKEIRLVYPVWNPMTDLDPEADIGDIGESIGMDNIRPSTAIDVNTAQTVEEAALELDKFKYLRFLGYTAAAAASLVYLLPKLHSSGQFVPVNDIRIKNKNKS